jgi:hypothetical protein
VTGARSVRPVAILLASLAGAAAVAGGAFAVQLSLDRPPDAARLATKVVAHVRERTIVYSVAWVGGRRVDAACRTSPENRYSLVSFGDGRSGVADWRAGRAFGRRPGTLGPLRNELLLAGCSAQIDRLLSREIRRQFARGRSPHMAPAIFHGEAALRLRIVPKPRLTYLFVDPHELVPVGLALRTPSVSADSLLDTSEPPIVSRHRPRQFTHG